VAWCGFAQRHGIEGSIVAKSQVIGSGEAHGACAESEKGESALCGTFSPTLRKYRYPRAHEASLPSKGVSLPTTWRRTVGVGGRESLVEAALHSAEGVQGIAATADRLHRMVERRRYNFARASTLYTFCVDAAVWKHLRGHPLRRVIYRNYLVSDDGPRRGEELARGFATQTGITDQSRPRRWLKLILGP
jgi:hypothetical protein